MNRIIAAWVELRHTILFAVRNLQRNKRRSIVTLISIAFGFTSLALFGGYTANIYSELGDDVVYGELLGHLTISRIGMDKEGRLHPELYLLGASDINKIGAIVRQIAPKARFAPRLALSGMVSNGKISTIFMAEGVDPTDMQTLRGKMAGDKGTLDPRFPTGFTVANGLVSLLGLKKGDSVSLLSATVRGQVNAIDGDIIDTFDTGFAGTNDKMMFIPLSQARSLYDADGQADRLTVVLPNVSQTDAVATQITAAFAAQKLPMQVQTWYELSAFYRQVKNFLDIIFTFLFTIVIVISTMALTNVISMNVVERTREIGMLRVLGMQRNGVVRLFIFEALMLTIFGCGGGFLLTLLLRLGINNANITYVPPSSSSPVPLTVGLDFYLIILTTLLLVALSVVAAWLPARRAVREPIIDAMGHV